MNDKIINSCKVAGKGSNFCEPKVANKDIVCYKIIERRDDGCYALIDPNYKYEEDIITGSMIEGKGKYLKNSWFNRIFLRQPKTIYKEEYIKWNEREQWFDITYGFIHTLSYKPNIKEGYLPIECKKNSHFELWECIIPEGTKYYQANRRGSHWESNNSYASKSIIFTKKIQECNYSGWWYE